MSFQPINVDFLINNDEVKTASDKVKKSLMDIGYTAEEAEKKINQKMNAALERQAFKTMPTLQQQGVKTQRVWNGLGNSINQLSREIPAFAVNAQTGFLAISNNLPIFADEIQRLRDKNAALTASGEKGVPIWKQLAKGILSWQTALSLGVALLTIYGKDIVDWIGRLIEGKDAVKSNSEALTEMGEKVTKTIGRLKSLVAIVSDVTVSEQKRLKAIRDLNKEFPEFNTNILDEKDNTKSLNDEVQKYIELIIKRAKLKATEEEIGKATIDLIELQEKRGKIEKKLSDDDEIIKNKTIKRLAEIRNALLTENDRTKRFKLVGEYDKSYELLTFTQQSYLSVLIDELKVRDKLNKLVNTSVGLSESEEATKKGTINYYKELIDANNKLISSKKTVNDLDAVRDLQAANAEYQKQIDLILNKKQKGDGGSDPASKYQSLIDKIAAIDAEYTRKSFTKDKEEQQALKDKFERVRKLVKEFNSKDENKAQIIDLTAFNALEGKATEDLIFRQETDKLKIELQEQKKLYKEFESFRTTFGEDAAQKEYANKIGDAQSYYDFLKKLERENKTAFAAVKNGTATGAQTERVDFISKQLKVATKEQQTEFNKQLADLLSYHQQRKILIENHEKLVADLIAKGADDKIAQAQQNHKEDLDKLDDANIKKLASYKALQRGIVGLTKKEAQVVIANAKALLDKVNISDDLRAKIKKAIAALEQDINQQSIDNLFQYTQRLGDLGNALQELGGVLGSSTVQNTGAFLSGIAGGLDDVFKAFDASKTETLKDDITAGIGAAISLISIFTSAAAKRKAAEEAYYLSVIGLQNDYNIALQEQQRLQSELAENVFMTDYVGRLQDGASAVLSANEGLQDALAELAEKGQVIAGQRNAIDWGNVGGATAAGAALGTAILPGIGTLVGAIGGFVAGLFGGKKKADEMQAILAEYPELITEGANGLQEINKELAESLIANNLVKGETKEILENIIEWQDALEAAREQIKSVISELAGGLGDDLRSALVDAFQAGEDAAVAMGDTVEKVLENVLSNFIFNEIFQQAFDELQEQMAASFDVGGDNDWVDDFSRFFTSASALTDDFNQAMQDAQAEASALGFSIFENTNNEQGIVGATRTAMTEDTANELTGLWRGVYDLQKRHYQVVEDFLARQDKSGQIFSSILLHIEATKVNTYLTVEELKKVNLKLIEINEKQKTEAKSRDLGI